jgi:hypothetical protein
MKPCNLMLRCIAEPVGDQWQAFCIDFDLAAQGSSFEDAKQRLDDQIRSYVHDALVGEDKEHADVLLFRRAPLPMVVRFHVGLVWQNMHSGMQRFFKEAIPMEPARHCHA